MEVLHDQELFSEIPYNYCSHEILAQLLLQDNV